MHTKLCLKQKTRDFCIIYIHIKYSNISVELYCIFHAMDILQKPFSFRNI